jgi:hypothetical protein
MRSQPSLTFKQTTIVTESTTTTTTLEQPTTITSNGTVIISQTLTETTTEPITLYVRHAPAYDRIKVLTPSQVHHAELHHHSDREQVSPICNRVLFASNVMHDARYCIRWSSEAEDRLTGFFSVFLQTRHLGCFRSMFLRGALGHGWLCLRTNQVSLKTINATRIPLGTLCASSIGISREVASLRVEPDPHASGIYSVRAQRTNLERSTATTFEYINTIVSPQMYAMSFERLC